MPTPQIFLFNLDTPKGAKLRRMCLPLKIRTRPVPKENFSLPLSALAAGEQASSAPTEEQLFPDEMLLLTDFSGPQLNALLEGFRRSHIPPVALKAVLTQTNRDWLPITLRNELLRERESIAQGGSAHQAP